MFGNLISLFHANEIAYRDDLIKTRRQFMRYPGSDAEVMIGGHPYNIHDWSFGGIAFDKAPLASDIDVMAAPVMTKGSTVRMAIRFHMMEETIEIPLTAEIIRIGDKHVVAKFNALHAETRKLFDRVMDLKNTEDFLKSQMAA